MVDGDKKVGSIRDVKPRRVIEMPVMDIVGKVQKPHVFYVIERGDLAPKDSFTLKRDLLKELEKTVEGL